MAQLSSGGVGAGTAVSVLSGIGVTALPATGLADHNSFLINTIAVCGGLVATSSIARIAIYLTLK